MHEGVASLKIIDLLKSPKVCVSCELFPPKKGSELEHAQEIVRTIAIQGVDYMSVTYGAGGTAVGKSVALVSEIERCGVPAPWPISPVWEPMKGKSKEYWTS